MLASRPAASSGVANEDELNLFDIGFLEYGGSGLGIVVLLGGGSRDWIAELIIQVFLNI